MELLFVKGQRVLLHREQMLTHPHAYTHIFIDMEISCRFAKRWLIA